MASLSSSISSGCRDLSGCLFAQPLRRKTKAGPSRLCVTAQVWASIGGPGKLAAGCQPLFTRLHHCVASLLLARLPWERDHWRLDTVAHPKLRQPLSGSWGPWDLSPGPANLCLHRSSSRNGWVLSPAWVPFYSSACSSSLNFFFFWWTVCVFLCVGLIFWTFS